MKNCLLLIGALVLLCTNLQAQLHEENVFGQYTLNHALVNPGATGFAETHLAQMNIKSNWAGFPGSPKTYALNYNGAVSPVLGLGITVRSENVAMLTRLHVAPSFACRFQVSEDLKLAGGLTAEFTTRRLSDAVLANKFYEGGDDIVQENITGVRYFDVSAGFYGAYKENTFFGVSLPNAVQTRLNTIISEIDTTSANFKSFTFLLGHKIYVKDQDFSVEPSILVKRINDVYTSPVQVDFNILTRFLEERLAAGLTYRYGLNDGGVLSILLGTKVTAFKVYYSYDVSFGQFQSYSGGAHEITLAFDLKGEDNRSRRKRQMRRKRR